MLDVTTIKAAIIKNRGGWEKVAEEEAFVRLWQSLDEATRDQYLASVAPPPEPAPDAVLATATPQVAHVAESPAVTPEPAVPAAVPETAEAAGGVERAGASD